MVLHVITDLLSVSGPVEVDGETGHLAELLFGCLLDRGGVGDGGLQERAD